MDQKEYELKRKQLMTDAQAALDRGDIGQAETLAEEVEKLDANFKAMTEPAKNFLEDLKQIDDKHMKVVETMNKEMTYDEVFAKAMKGETLNTAEIGIYDAVNIENAYTHTAENTPVVVPETVVDEIYGLIGEDYPFFGDVRKLAIRGNVSIPRHTAIAEGDAAWYDEDTATADEKNTFDAIVLNGCELSKAISVSWKLQKMATPAFLNYISTELADRMTAALGAGVTQGQGPTEGTHPEPTGVVTQLKKTGTQVVSYTGEPTYANITEAISKIHSKLYTGSAVYANQKTIWTVLANIKDANGLPIFIPDASLGGVGMLFGLPVKADAGFKDGEILIGNAAKGYIVNENEAMSITMDNRAKARTTDYVAYLITDGGVADEKAFGLLAPQDAEEPGV